jgi:hypothetical protein
LIENEKQESALDEIMPSDNGMSCDEWEALGVERRLLSILNFAGAGERPG